MTIIANVTNEILSKKFPIKYVSYSKDKTIITINVSHADSWDFGKTQAVDWDEFIQNNPCLAELELKEGAWLCSKEFDNSEWVVEKQK